MNPVIPMLLSLCGPAAAEPAPLPAEALVAEVMGREEELLEAVRATDPEEHGRMLRLRDVDRGAYVVALFRVARAVDRAKADPASAARRTAIRAKEAELRRLAKGWVALPAAERPARRASIEALAAEVLELKQTERRARLEELRARLEELTREIDAREANRDRLVREYVDQLLQERVDL